MEGIRDPYGTCRQCGGRVLWIKTKSGKNMPVNPKLINYKAVPGGKERIVTPKGAVVVGEKCSVDDAEGYGYISHFATCEYANMFRKKKRNDG